MLFQLKYICKIKFINIWNNSITVQQTYHCFTKKTHPTGTHVSYITSLTMKYSITSYDAFKLPIKENTLKAKPASKHIFTKQVCWPHNQLQNLGIHLGAVLFQVFYNGKLTKNKFLIYTTRCRIILV